MHRFISGARARLLAVVTCMFVLAVSAFAQTTPDVDWAAHGTTIKDSVVANLNLIIPAMLALFGIFIGIRLFLRLLKKGTSG